jgi:hypothetical protein
VCENAVANLRRIITASKSARRLVCRRGVGEGVPS